MSAPHIILDCLPSFCQKLQIWWKFDMVITKIILLVFYWDTVYIAVYARTNHNRQTVTITVMILKHSNLILKNRHQAYVHISCTYHCQWHSSGVVKVQGPRPQIAVPGVSSYATDYTVNIYCMNHICTNDTTFSTLDSRYTSYKHYNSY